MWAVSLHTLRYVHRIFLSSTALNIRAATGVLLLCLPTSVCDSIRQETFVRNPRRERDRILRTGNPIFRLNSETGHLVVFERFFHRRTSEIWLLDTFCAIFLAPKIGLGVDTKFGSFCPNTFFGGKDTTTQEKNDPATHRRDTLRGWNAALFI